jgi:hypothetical protein
LDFLAFAQTDAGFLMRATNEYDLSLKFMPVIIPVSKAQPSSRDAQGTSLFCFPFKRIQFAVFRGPAAFNAMRDLRVPRLTALTAAFCVSEAQRTRRSVQTCIHTTSGSPSDGGVAPGECQHSDYCDRSSRIPPPRSLSGRTEPISVSVFGLDCVDEPRA